MDKLINGLLIEDDPDDTMLLLELLAGSDWPSFRFAFTCAETLEEGLKFLREGAFEVVVTDLMLPDSRGLETVRRVRAQNPEIPLVVLTGLSDEAMGLDAVAAGAQDYQVKGGLSSHALKRTIGFAVERHRLSAGLRNTIEDAPDAMVVVDAHDAVRYLNPAAEKLFGAPKDQLLRRTLPYKLPSGASGEMKIPQPGGGERVAEVRSNEVQWGDATARLLSIRDITDLRRLEQLKAEIQENRRMDKLKDQLMSAISHEMRTPLTIIKAAVFNMEEGLTGGPTEAQAKMLKLAHRNVERLERIVDNTLDLARLESGGAIINAGPLDAARLIGETAAGFDLVAKEKGLSLEREIPDRLPKISADPELFVEVLENLLSNAMRYARSKIILRARTVDWDEAGGQPAASRAKGGGVAVSARRCVQLSVVDDGKGIPKDRLGELFNRFVQVDRRQGDEGYGGVGLGLALCKEMVDRQKGKIWVESDAGAGAAFHFALPLA